MTSFHLIIAVTALLTTLGLIMVLSASGVHSYDEDGSPWVIFAKQVLWTLVGLIAFAIWGAHLLATRRLERASLREMLFPLVPAAVLALFLIVLQPDLGQTV